MSLLLQRIGLLVEPLNKMLGADFGIPIFELPVLFDAKENVDTDFTTTRREIAFRNLHFTYFNIMLRMNNLSCLSVIDSKR